jgi:alpha-beta hydrolase superfamily lysophospholipase
MAALPGLREPQKGKANHFVMSDEAVLPYREWLPDEAPQIVVLALHGINDSADAWESPSAMFVNAGIALIAPDQRGFGAATGGGVWPGTEIMLSDAMAMIKQVRDRFPNARLYLAGESMGGAIAMVLAARQNSHWIDGYVLSSPAVWGRREMTVSWRMLLWLANKTVPWLRLNAVRLGLKPSDNEAAFKRKGRPGGALPSASISALAGLTDLMDLALQAAGKCRAPSLCLYGGKDQLVPKRAIAACWHTERAAEATKQVFAYYPGGYHLLQRDHAGAVVTRDIVNWLLDPEAPLLSGADACAHTWLDGTLGKRTRRGRDSIPLIDASGKSDSPTIDARAVLTSGTNNTTARSFTAREHQT